MIDVFVMKTKFVKKIQQLFANIIYLSWMMMALVMKGSWTEFKTSFNLSFYIRSVFVYSFSVHFVDLTFVVHLIIAPLTFPNGAPAVTGPVTGQITAS